MLTAGLVLVQGADPAGLWRVTADSNVRRNADGTTEVGGTTTFDMFLEVNGEAVSGRWEGFTEQEPWRVSGTWREGRLHLTSEWRDVPASRGGEATTVRVRLVIEGRFRDGGLEGTLRLDRGATTARAPIAFNWRAVRP